MSFGSASKENAISKAYHSLTLIAGLEAVKDNKARPVDLNVRGGGIFNKNLVVCGNIDVESFLNGSVNGNIFTNHIMASNITEGIYVVGNLIIDNDFTLQANSIIANTITSSSGDLTLEASNMIVLNTPTVVITGNLETDTVCAPTVQTDLIEAKTGTTIDIDGTLNLLDGNIVSSETITICNDGDLILKPTGFVIISNLAQELDLSKQIISNVLAVEAAAGCDLSLKADPGYTVNIACGDGIDMMGRDIFMNNGNIVGIQNIMPYGNENVMVCGNLEIKAGGNLVVNGGDLIFAGGDLDLENGNIINVQNIVPTSGGNVLICGNLEVKNGGDIIVNDGDMIVNQGDVVVNNGDLNLTDGNIVNVTNIMPSPSGTGNVQVCGNLEIKNGGDIVINDGDMIVNQGDIVVNEGDLNLTGGNITNVTNIIPSPSGTGNVLICGNLEVKNGGDIIVNDGDMIVNQGDLVVNEGDLNLTGGNITNVTNIMPSPSGTGNVLICGNLEIKNGGDIVVNEGDLIVNEGDLNLTGGNITNVTNIMPSASGTGNVLVCGNLEIKNGGDLVINEGDINLTGGNITNVTNIMPSPSGTGNVLICGNLEVKNGGDIIVNDGDMIVNQGDLVVNEGDLNLTGGNITNVTNIMPSTTGTGNVLICGNLEIKNGGDIVVNEGDLIVNEGDLNLTGGNITNVTNIMPSTSGTGNVLICGNLEIKSGGDLVINEGDINLTGGNITNVTNIMPSTTGNVLICGNLEIKNGGDLVINEGDINLTGGNITNVTNIMPATGGNVLVCGNLEIKSGGDLVINEGDINLTGGNITNVTNIMPTTGGNVLVCGNLEIKSGGDLIINEGDINLTGGNITNVTNIIGDPVTGNIDLCGNVNLKTGTTINMNGGNITNVTNISTTATGGNVTVNGNLDMMCGEIFNLQTLRVDDVFGKASPVNFQDELNIASAGARITFEDGVQIGTGSTAATNSVAIGVSTSAGPNSLAIKGASGNSGVALLGTATTQSVAIGVGTSTSAFGDSVSVGFLASSTGQYGVALGRETTATGQSSVAIGGGNYFYSATSTGNASIAIGRISTASANYAVAIGRGSTASVQNCIALGNGSTAENTNGIAIGTNARSGNANSIAIGPNAVTKGDDRALAIGLNPMSVITSGAVPYLQCVVNGDDYEIPLTIVGLGATAAGNASIFRIDQSGSQTIPNGTTGDNVTMTLEHSENFDDPGNWSGNTFTLTKTGWYNISASADFEPLDQTGTIQIVVNGNETDCVGDTRLYSTPGNAIMTVDCTTYLTIGDTVRVKVKQNTDSSKDVYNSSFTIYALTGLSTPGQIVSTNLLCANVKVVTDKIEPKTSAGNVCVTGNLIVTESLFVSNIVGNSPVTCDDDLIVLGALDVAGVVNFGAPLGASEGGTGQSVFSTGDVLYAIGASALGKLGVGTNGQVLTVSGGLPSWSTPTSSLPDIYYAYVNSNYALIAGNQFTILWGNNGAVTVSKQRNLGWNGAQGYIQLVSDRLYEISINVVTNAATTIQIYEGELFDTLLYQGATVSNVFNHTFDYLAASGATQLKIKATSGVTLLPGFTGQTYIRVSEVL